MTPPKFTQGATPSFNKDLEVSASPTPKESQKAIPSLNPDIKRNKVPDLMEMKK